MITCTEEHAKVIQFATRDNKNLSPYSLAAQPPMDETGLKLPEVMFGKAEASVLHCKDCKHCFSLCDTDPRKPYDGAGDGFYCEMWDMDLYAPTYKAERFYCADGERR